MNDPTLSGDNTDFSFDAIYRGDSPFGDHAPWDIDGPQPSYVALEAAGLITGDVLDSGCGTGDNALYLASKGHPVTGIDSAPTAIDIARCKAAERGLPATFDTADALELPGYHAQFDTVIDSALAHLFTTDELTRYAAALHRACRPGATVHVLAISDRATAFIRTGHAELAEQMEAQLSDGNLDLNEMLPSLTAHQLRTGFADDWATESLTETTLRAHLPFQPDPINLPAWLARFRRL
ncbi:class I SAM-dependent methyltransferase [Nocardia sp. NPDC051030]|uniref:class I SAM-dependent methyltransferase n=1 Tax=Nocardia sp. NPDC051030 TaxID=3155162 RepID=UPI0034444612